MLAAVLDHIILGVDDLDRGIDRVEEFTGVRAIPGGVHPGRGTRNALISLARDRYLEIIAPDPQQSTPSWFPQIVDLAEPRLIAWAVHASDLTRVVNRALAAGFAIDGPHDGARSRPDGRVLTWKLFHLRDDCGGLLPFFIEWGRGSIHPAADTPIGCTLDRFSLQSPEAFKIKEACTILGVDVD